MKVKEVMGCRFHNQNVTCMNCIFKDVLGACYRFRKLYNIDVKMLRVFIEDVRGRI